MLEINLLNGYEKDYYTFPELEKIMGNIGGNFRGKIERLLKKGKIRVKPRPTQVSYEIRELPFVEFEKLKKQIAEPKFSLSPPDIRRVSDIQNLRFNAEDVHTWKRRRKVAFLTAFAGLVLALCAEKPDFSRALATWIFGAHPDSLSMPKRDQTRSDDSHEAEVRNEWIGQIQATIARKREELASSEASFQRWRDYAPQTPEDQVQKLIELATLRERIMALQEAIQEEERRLESINNIDKRGK